MAELYEKLPIELQRVIKSYFHVWQRKGFNQEPKLLCPSPDLYFKKIRKCPSRMKLSFYGKTLYYKRRQKDFFQWIIRVNSENPTDDRWEIEMCPQWQNTEKEKQIILKIFFTHVWHQVPVPNGAELMDVSMDLQTYQSMLYFEFIVKRAKSTLPPSRQEMVGLFSDYLSQLAPLVEKTRKDLQQAIQI